LTAAARYATQHAQQDLSFAGQVVQRPHLRIVPTRKPA
jgi:hypothetical protein